MNCYNIIKTKQPDIAKWKPMTGDKDKKNQLKYYTRHNIVLYYKHKILPK